jgi:transketolase
MRAYEQIRIDIAYHNLNVKLIGVGGGFTYGLEGYSHFGIEDLSLMRSLQNMNVVVPADAEEARVLTELSYNFPNPLYIRLGRTGEPCIHNKRPSFKIGKGMVLSSGKKVAIFAIGSMVYQSQLAAALLTKKGILPTIINMHTLKPLDKKLIEEIALSHKAIFSVEEHNVTGGLGSAIAEVLAEISYKGLFKRIGIPDKLENFIGDADSLKNKYSLNANGIAKIILKEV